MVHPCRIRPDFWQIIRNLCSKSNAPVFEIHLKRLDGFKTKERGEIFRKFISTFPDSIRLISRRLIEDVMQSVAILPGCHQKLCCLGVRGPNLSSRSRWTAMRRMSAGSLIDEKRLRLLLSSVPPVSVPASRPAEPKQRLWVAYPDRGLEWLPDGNNVPLRSRNAGSLFALPSARSSDPFSPLLRKSHPSTGAENSESVSQI